MADDVRRLDQIPLDEIKGNDANPKDHADGVLTESVARFGYVEPVVIDARTGLLVSGHGRIAALRAMRDAGQQPPDGIATDEQGGWLIPAVTGWASRSDDEAAAALVALNRTTELGGWHNEQLVEILDNLTYSDDGLLGVGYHPDDLEQLRVRLGDLDDGNDADVALDGLMRFKPEHEAECPACGATLRIAGNQVTSIVDGD